MAVATPQTRTRGELPPTARWELSDIFPGWEAWEEAFATLAAHIDEFAQFRGTLDQGAGRLRAALVAHDELDMLAHRVWWYPSLMHDEDLRDNEVEARKQRVGNLLARASTASSWLHPEVLALGADTVRAWMEQDEQLAVYRFALEELFRQQEHVLDAEREELLSLSQRLGSTPREAYSMLSTADVEYPTITLTGGRERRLSYAEYHRILNRERAQEDRARAFSALYQLYEAKQNTYAALYAGVCQRGWFHARARRYGSSLEAALHGNDIPVGVVEELLRTTREGTAPLQRYYRLRQRTLGVDGIHLFDGSVPLLEGEPDYPYDEACELVAQSVAPLGESYQRQVREAFASRWIDVYENEGKRSGAYSAPVYGVHPYMLLNYKDGMDDMFTLAHEMGHSMHTVLSHGAQPFCYSNYTIFVAEVASTLNEALLLEHLLQRSDDPRERVLLLQHAIDSIAGTFYTQVLFAQFELDAHRAVERDEPLTADALSRLYMERLRQWYGDSVELDELYRVTWARIPHFFRSPFYVYQYATCFASAAVLVQPILQGSPGEREAAVARYLRLLSAGSSDSPMALLREAGVDLSTPEPVQAVVAQMDDLVGRLEGELGRL